jgi:FkbM family methyltransferase
MKCVFKPGCRAADVGGNVGMMTYTMLALGAHVVTVEPQEDLCNVTKRTAALNGWGSRSQVFCAGAAGAQPGERSLTVNLGHGFRIGRPTRNDTVVVPLLDLNQVLTSDHYDFIKIDTDSIDCVLLGQLVAEIGQGNRTVDSLVLETWEDHCKGGVLSGLVYQLQQLNYTVYRTLLWERHFDSKGGLPTPLAVEKLPEYATEVFGVRYAR